MVELGDRLKKAMTARKVGIPELAGAVHMSYQGIRKIVQNCTKEMEASTCAKISKFLKIDAEWLRTGSGSMEPRGSDANSANRPPARISIDAALDAMIVVIGKIPPDKRDPIARALSVLALAPDSAQSRAQVLIALENADSGHAAENVKGAENIKSPPRQAKTGTTG